MFNRPVKYDTTIINPHETPLNRIVDGYINHLNPNDETRKSGCKMEAFTWASEAEATSFVRSPPV